MYNDKKITTQITTKYNSFGSLSDYLKDILQNEIYTLYEEDYYGEYIIKMITNINLYNLHREYVISRLSNLEKQQLQQQLVKK